MRNLRCCLSDSCTQTQRGEGGEGQAHTTSEKSSHQKHHPHRHNGDTPEDIATHDRELYGVRDSAKLNSVRVASYGCERVRGQGGRARGRCGVLLLLLMQHAAMQAVSGQPSPSTTPARVRDGTMRS